MTIEPAELENFLDSTDLRAIIGKNAGKFRAKWRDRLKKHTNQGHAGPIPPWRMGFIWWLLLTYPFWFVYRKLYRCFALWLVAYAFSYLLDNISFMLSMGFMLVVNTVYFFFASGWYAEHCLALRQEGQSVENRQDRADFYHTTGKVDPLSTAAAVLVWLLWSIYGIYSFLDELGVLADSDLMLA